MSKWVKSNLKKIVSWTLGLPAALVMFSEVEDVRYWFIPFIAAGVLFGILFWNRIITLGDLYE